MENYSSTQPSCIENEDREILSKKTNLSFKIDLKVIEENEENLDANQGNISEEESLGYNSNYKIFHTNSINKDGQNTKDISSKRKASTVSTSISQTDICSDINCFSPTNESKQIIFDRKMTNPSQNPQTSHVYFGRERRNSTPLNSYFEGIELYLRNLQPEKDRYKKSNNYIEKERYFKENNNYYRDYKYKSFDLTENKKFNSSQILKNVEEHFNNNNNNNNNNNKEKTIPVENNNNIFNNKNINVPLTPKYNNSIYGKFDMPFPYFGYYRFDCKYYIYWYNFILVSNGLSLKTFNPKSIDLNNKNKEIQNGNKNEEEKTIGTVFIPTPIFFNPMIKQTKGYYGKYQKKKTRPFTEREGDWICKQCKNLNFAFRNECNRCKMAKKDAVEIAENKEENDDNNKSNMSNNSNKKIYKSKKSYTTQYNDKDYKQEITTHINKNEE